jgi:hypothetical protein
MNQLFQYEAANPTRVATHSSSGQTADRHSLAAWLSQKQLLTDRGDKAREARNKWFVRAPKYYDILSITCTSMRAFTLKI